MHYRFFTKTFCVICAALLLVACKQHGTGPYVISLSYQNSDIRKQFDTLYSKQQASPGIYKGFTEQALAICHDSTPRKDTITQDVFSSMYLNPFTNRYDCVTTTTFRFADGTICAMGVFNLTPGDTIAPDHDFPITGGSATYRNIYGTYTRKYINGIYHVGLRYYKLEK
ncbi:hypothetical protein BEL04_05490 [Mucilaginibacter sp. PPCGB 2223]|uniref:hypothetical protein n=1 Tax=Mucilaginibacter sp. PPCGB 2223 TaxID=1886027 RepID=UPI000826A73E|nr:hypothetical protein [Mucilaginibacter sp. PPCGB 2223]OCX53742.1 hypothetical protein BEL04_05490 [Mucilaginibacter sp. PPCGB 2223]